MAQVDGFLLDSGVHRFIFPPSFTEVKHSALLTVLESETKSPFIRIGWLDEARTWD
jgi:hypothetical protein